MKSLPKYYLILFILAALINLKCGVYGFRGNNPPEGIRTIALPLFQDNSGFSEANFKENFTENLKNKLINDNTFRLADKNVADGLLNCTVVSVTDDPLVISGNESVAKRKITIGVNIDFQNLKTQRTILTRRYENWGEYQTSSGSFSERQRGVQEAINRICEDILNDITSNW